MKTDRAKNFLGGAIEELSKELKIWKDTSSVYHPAGNTLIESTVGRIKRVLGRRKIEDAMRDINALNLSQPYNYRLLTPNEEMTHRISPVNGIPVTETVYNSLVTNDYAPTRIERSEYKGTNPTKGAQAPLSEPATPNQQAPVEETPTITDEDEATKEENNLSKDWEEPASTINPTSKLSCGDRVFYIDFQVGKGPRKWKPGIIIQRKKEYNYSTGIRESHRFDIYDIQNCTYVTRTRKDIRKYKHTKVERKIMDRANKHLAEMREEFMKNKRFIGPGFEVPPEFELNGYIDKPRTPLRHEGRTKPEPQPNTQETQQEQTTEQPTPRVDTQAELPGTVEPTPTGPPPEQKRTKPSRELSRLQSDLNGIAWQCDSSHRPRRYRNERIWEEDPRNSWDNTEPIDAEATQENIGQ